VLDVAGRGERVAVAGQEADQSEVLDQPLLAVVGRKRVADVRPMRVILGFHPSMRRARNGDGRRRRPRDVGGEPARATAGHPAQV
jgi:hypothetical protein